MKKRLITISMVLLLTLICCIVYDQVSNTPAEQTTETHVSEKTNIPEHYGVITSGFWPTAESDQVSLVLYLFTNDIEFEAYTVGMDNLHLFIFTEDEGILNQKTEWLVWYNISDGSLHNSCFKLVDCSNETLIQLLSDFFTETQPDIYRNERQHFENYVWKTYYFMNEVGDESNMQSMNLVVFCDYFEYDNSPFSVYIHYDNELGADYHPDFYADCFSSFYADYSEWEPY